MTIETNEQRILEILGAWQEAQDRGTGMAPEEVIASHPDLATELRARFDVLRLVEQIAQESQVLDTAKPERLGEYRLLREIGRGGMGVVYEVEQMSLGRIVALKVLYPSITSSRTAVKRFRREAKATARLHHTNIVGVHSLGEESGTWFYAMDLVRGLSLDEVLEQARMSSGEESPTRAQGLTTGIDDADDASSPSEGSPRTSIALHSTAPDRSYFANVARMFAEVAEALQAAHDAGVIHRDIKPSNLMLDHAGMLHITDFGVARLVDSDASMTVTGELLGTPVYMSPEQARARSTHLDHRTDVYSLGATLYEALTMRPPFESSNLAQVYKDVLTREPVSPRVLVRTIPLDLETIVVKAMEKEPGARYASAGDMAADLRAYAEDRPIGARRIGPVQRAWRTARRHKKLVGAVALVLGLAVAATLFWARASQEEEVRRDLQYEALLREHGTNLWYERGSEVIRTALDEAIALRPERPEAYYLRSMFSHDGAVEECLADVERAARRGLDPKTALLAAWRLHTLQGNEEEAAKARSEAARLPSETADTFRLEGLVHYQEGDLAQAETALTEAIARAEPDSWMLSAAMRERANVRLRRGDETGALSDAMAAGLGSLPVPEIDVTKAMLLRRLGRESQAERVIAALLSNATARNTQALWERVLDQTQGSEQQDWLDRATSAALQARPGDGELHAWRAIYLTTNGRPGAVEAAQRAVALCDEGSWVSRILAGALTNAGRRDEAERVIRAYVEAHPDDFQGHWQLSHTLQARGRYEEALEAHKRVLALARADRQWEAMAGEASLLSKLGRNDEADLALERALAHGGDSSYLHSIRAQLRLAHDDYEGTIAAATEALRRNKDDALAKFLRGSAYVERREFEKARRDLSEAIAVFPANGRLHLSLGMALEGLGQRDAAAKEFRIALEHVDEMAGPSGVYVMLVMNAFGRGDVNEAVDFLEAGLRHLPDSADILGLQIQVLRSLGKAEEAMEAAEVMMERVGPRKDAYLQIAMVAIGLGRLDRARRAIEHMLALDDDPKYGPPAMKASALGHLARILLSEGRVEEALARLDEAVAIDLPGSQIFAHELHQLRLEVLIELERYDEALAQINTMVRVAPPDRKPHKPHLTAWIEVLRERSDEVALDLTTKLVEAHPDHLPVWQLHAHQVAMCDGAQAGLRVIEEARERFPSDPSLLFRRGWWKAVAGRCHDGLADFDQALKQMPWQRAIVLHGRLQVLLMLGRFKEALDLAESLHDGYGHAASRNALALGAFALASLGRVEEAKARLETLRRRWPTKPFLGTVEACLLVGDPERALEEAQWLGERTISVELRVRTLRAAGRHEEAKSLAWEHAGRKTPPEETALRAYLAAVAGAPERARELLQAVPPTENVDTLRACARAWFVLGEEEEARAWRSKAEDAGWVWHPGVARDPDLPR